MRSLIASLSLIALSACGSTPNYVPASTPPPTPGPSLSTGPTSTGPDSGGGFRPPNVLRESGIDRVIGARAEQLTAAFGSARIDLTEGDARKLQFAGEECVLDVFLYPLEPNEPPIATHLEARVPENGESIDRAVCIDALER
ncbi:MAG: hypothetical protein AAGK02_10600 [Pseudomonadota bacterium]